MAEPIWLTRQIVELIHLEQLAEHGGRRGLRDENALESALARPRQRWAYEPEPSLADLAASLCFGLARNHPFIDGNKRVSFLAAYTFLRLNGLIVEAEEDDVISTMEAIASGELGEDQLAAWLSARVTAT